MMIDPLAVASLTCTATVWAIGFSALTVAYITRNRPLAIASVAFIAYWSMY